MNTGTLTPRSADVVADMMFSGDFGQPTGFSSVLKVLVRQNGGCCLSLEYTANGKPMFWAVELTNEQRRELAKLLACYEPRLSEPINKPMSELA